MRSLSWYSPRLDIKVVVEADQLDEPGDFSLVIASTRARSAVEG